MPTVCFNEGQYLNNFREICILLMYRFGQIAKLYARSVLISLENSNNKVAYCTVSAKARALHQGSPPVMERHVRPYELNKTGTQMERFFYVTALTRIF